jgi:hypothetical protein
MPSMPPSVNTGWPPAVQSLLERALSCEYASLTRSGAPITWPLNPFVEPGRRTFDVSTGVTYPAKAERARHDPRVALLFSKTPSAPIILVQGLATVRDADLQETTDRYVRRSLAKFPHLYEKQPWFLVRRQTWYWTRMWIEVTPLRMTWWPGGRLDGEPLHWRAAPDVAAPPSDPAPAGAMPPAWTAPPADWRPYAQRATRLGNPIVTVRDADGWPLPLPALHAEPVDDGFLVRVPGVETIRYGRACLTFHTHPESFNGQENVVLVGDAAPVDGGVHVRVERALPDFSLVGGRLKQLRTFLGNGRLLSPRLAHECARRDQPVPVVRKPS